MNATEMRELDAWIAENVMGWKRTGNIIKEGCFTVVKDGTCLTFGFGPTVFSPTTDKAAAFEVWFACVKKASAEMIWMNTKEPMWRIMWYSNFEHYETVEHSDPQICICLFARQLFAKEGV